MSGCARRLGIALVLLAGCRRHSAPAATMPPSTSAEPSAATPAAAAPDLCHDRPGCSVARQPVAGAPGVALVVVRLAYAPDASTDADRCDRREYWLSRPTGDILVAVDCERQWGADNAGPATITVRGKRLEISYVEMQSGDRCESYSATIEAVGPRLVESQSRVVGSIVKDVCHPGQAAAPVDPVGDGLRSPLLTLHR